MKRVHPSGASKRKEKKRKYLEIKKSSKTLNLWLAGPSCDSSNNDKSQTGRRKYKLLIRLYALT